MHPALSVIFFTAVSGTGYGLLFLLGVVLAAAPYAIDPIVALLTLGAGLAFTATGLLSSLLHLGQPQRAWRALSQWRSSWLSREGIAAVIGFAPMLALVALTWHYAGVLALHDATARTLAEMRGAAAMLALASAATVYCTARIYTTLKTIPAWHNPYVLPGYLLLGLLGGATLLWMIDAAAGLTAAPSLARALPGAVVLLALGSGLLKLRYWHWLDVAPAASTTGSATGLGQLGDVGAVEAPHSEANYLTREMGFVLARKHARRLRAVAIGTIALVPTAVVVAAVCVPTLRLPSAAVAAASSLAGVFVERWLFFAEARHVVMLYYASNYT